MGECLDPLVERRPVVPLFMPGMGSGRPDREHHWGAVRFSGLGRTRGKRRRAPEGSEIAPPTRRVMRQCAGNGRRKRNGAQSGRHRAIRGPARAAQAAVGRPRSGDLHRVRPDNVYGNGPNRERMGVIAQLNNQPRANRTGYHAGRHTLPSQDRSVI